MTIFSLWRQSVAQLPRDGQRPSRWAGNGLAGVMLATLLAGCAGPVPNPTLYVLHSAPPVQAQVPTQPLAASAQGVSAAA